MIQDNLAEVNGQAVQREVVNKATGEVFPVTGTIFGDGVVEFMTEEETFSFENKNDNTFETELYLVREV